MFELMKEVRNGVLTMFHPVSKTALSISASLQLPSPGQLGVPSMGDGPVSTLSYWVEYFQALQKWAFENRYAISCPHCGAAYGEKDKDVPVGDIVCGVGGWNIVLDEETGVPIGSQCRECGLIQD